MQDIHYEQLGIATDLLCQAHAILGSRLAHCCQRVRVAIMHDQIQFAFDEVGDPVAFWIWAFPSLSVEQRLMTNPYTPLHESEWDEGGRLWILDIVSPFGYLRDIARHLARHLLPEHSTAMSARRRRDGRVKTSLWTRPSTDRAARQVTPRLTLPASAFAASWTEWLSAATQRPDDRVNVGRIEKVVTEL